MAITLDGTTGIITPTVTSGGALSGTTATFTTVGIGNASPAVSLDIGGTTIPQIRMLSNTNAVDLRLQAVGGSSTAVIGTLSNHPLAVFTNNTEKMRVDVSGNVGIGTSSPGKRLDVAGDVVLPNNGILNFYDAGGVARNTVQFLSGEVRLGGAGAGISTQTFYTSATERMRIEASGLITQLNATSGRGDIAGTQIFRLAADGSAIGPAIADYYGATSSISLEAASMYEITFHAFFLKTTAGTVVFTLTGSSAPTSVVANYIGTPIAGVGGAGVVGTITSVATAATAFAATGSLTTAVNHAYEIKARVLTNLATNFKLQVTSSAGTVTPRAGSYYTVKKISASTGTFV